MLSGLSEATLRYLAHCAAICLPGEPGNREDIHCLLRNLVDCCRLARGKRSPPRKNVDVSDQSTLVRCTDVFRRIASLCRTVRMLRGIRSKLCAAFQRIVLFSDGQALLRTGYLSCREGTCLLSGQVPCSRASHMLLGIEAFATHAQC